MRHTVIGIIFIAACAGGSFVEAPGESWEQTSDDPTADHTQEHVTLSEDQSPESTDEEEDGIAPDATSIPTEGESESESENEICELSEACDDELDNDCDNWVDCDDLECSSLPACAQCAELDDGWVRGAPGFFLHAETPDTIIWSGPNEIMRLRVMAANDEGCAPIEITELPILIWFSDHASTGWLPQSAHIRNADTNEVIALADPYMEDWEELRHFLFRDSIVLTPNHELTLSIWASLDGISLDADDWVQAELTPEVYWRIYGAEDRSEYVQYFDVLGDILSR